MTGSQAMIASAFTWPAIQAAAWTCVAAARDEGWPPRLAATRLPADGTRAAGAVLVKTPVNSKLITVMTARATTRAARRQRGVVSLPSGGLGRARPGRPDAPCGPKPRA